jgi:hypothetical protein
MAGLALVISKMDVTETRQEVIGGQLCPTENISVGHISMDMAREVYIPGARNRGCQGSQASLPD